MMGNVEVKGRCRCRRLCRLCHVSRGEGASSVTLNPFREYSSNRLTSLTPFANISNSCHFNNTSQRHSTQYVHSNYYIVHNSINLHFALASIHHHYHFSIIYFSDPVQIRNTKPGSVSLNPWILQNVRYLG